MKRFDGFPPRMQFTPVPNLFFSSLLPEITDISELKITLHIIKAIYSKKGYLRYVTYSELMSDTSLMIGLGNGTIPSEKPLKESLEQAVKRGTILLLILAGEDKPEDVYFLNDESGRKSVDKIQNGEMVLSGLKAAYKPDINSETPPDIFTVYEQNVGMLTPMIADELREAEKLYPESWIRDAIKESAHLNKRNWRYIERILENWLAESRGDPKIGRQDGTRRGDSKTNPDKFSKQKFGDIVQR